MTLEDLSTDVPAYFRSMRFNRALEVWNVDASVTNLSALPINGPLVLVFESLQNVSGLVNPDGLVEGLPYVNLSQDLADGVLPAGGGSAPRTLTLGRSGDAAPVVQARVYGRRPDPGSALALTRSLDAAGLPLPDVQVDEIGPAGARVLRTDPRFGLVTLGHGPGAHAWKFSRAGFLPVWRSATLGSESVGRIPHPRLTPQSTNTQPLAIATTGLLIDAARSVEVEFAAGSVAEATTATLTLLDGQRLPGLLPQGWSPLSAFWLELGASLAQPATVRLAPAAEISPTDTVTLARWDTDTLAWQAGPGVVGAGTNRLSFELAGGGAYALVLPDRGLTAPAAAVAGQALPASSFASPDDAGLAAEGTVDPSVNVASRVPELVTAQATVHFHNVQGPLPSGTVLPTEIDEDYRMADGTRRITPRYDTFVVGYQRPGPGSGALAATFPLRPLLLLGGEELAEARVTVDVLAPFVFAGGVLETNGGLVAAGDLQVLAGAGDFARPQAALLRRFDPTNFTGLAVGGFEIAEAFQLDVPEVEPARHLAAHFGPQPTNSVFVLARILVQDGLYGIEPVERFVSGADGRLQTAEPAGAATLARITGAGQYLLLRVPQAQALVTGTARDAQNNLLRGAAVRLEPWLTFTGGDGAYRLLAPAGSSTLALTDPATGNTGQRALEITDPQVPILADLTTAPTGPRVTALSPTNGAPAVARVTPVVVTFSEPVNPGTLVGNGLQLLGPGDALVNASLSLNLAGTVATLLPVDPLAPSTLFTLRLSPDVADLTGLKLEGPREFTFTTQSDALNRVGGQLISFEPTNGVVGLRGTAGTAEPESPVILVNETTGQTATILSQPDGSFTNSIPGGEEDLFNAVLVNANGTRSTLPVGRQVFRDGSVGLFAGGGTISTEVEGRTVDVVVEPGAIQGRTLFKVDPIPSAVTRDLARVFPPSEGRLVTPGIMVSMAENPLRGAIDVEFPITRAELEAGGLAPGDDPTNSVFALVAAVPTGGTLAYVLIDKMVYENGKLVTHSEPHPGVDSIFRAVARAATTAVDAASRGAQAAGRNAQQVNLDIQRFIREHAENISSAVDLGQVAADIVAGLVRGGGAGVTAAGTGGVGFFAGALAQSVALLPLQMANASVPLTMSGEVIEIDFERGADGQILSVGNARPLAGAMVRADDVGSGSLLSGRPGRIQPGALFSISRVDGRYSMIRAGPRGAFEDLNFALSATHARYFGVTVRQMANPRAFGLLSRTDLAFYREVGANVAPPSLSVTHTPTAPEPEGIVEIEVIATTAGQPSTPVRPEVEVTLGALNAVPGSPPPRLADVQLAFVRSEDAGTLSRRVIYQLRSATKAEVTLRVAGYVPFCDQALAQYTIRIGSPIDRPEEPPPPDLADIRGPRVLQHEPAQDARAWPVDGVIRLRFSEAMSRSLTNHPTLIRMIPDAGEPALALSADGRELSLAFPNLNPGEAYRLILPAAVATDASHAGNLLDQLPETPARESFELRFQAAPQLAGDLTGLVTGGGAVVNGIYAYVLERHGPLDGAVVVYDLSNPAAPQRAGELSVPGFPRDLVLIPNYSFQVRPGEAPRTADLLAVAGGKIGSTFTREGENLGGFQYLWVIDLSEPGLPRRLASAVLSTTGSSAVNRLQWSPPFLTALISDSEIQQIDLVKLQPFIFGLNLTDAEFATMPFLATPGVDANLDGDYVDFLLGDELPLPGRKPGNYAGRELVLAPDPELKARWADQHFNGLSGTLGVVTFEGKNRDGSAIAGAYQTVFRSGQALDPAAATFVFREDRPRRVLLVSDVPIPTPQGRRVGEVALLSMMSAQGQGWVATLDITEARSPRLVSSNAIPAGLGTPQSAQRLPDGRIALATSTHLLVLDPERLAEAAPEGSHWPALQGSIPGFGAAGRTFGLDGSGLVANASLGRNVAGLSAPRLGFVQQPGGDAPVSPAALREMAQTNLAAAVEFLASLIPTTDLAPARWRAVPGVVDSGVFPPQRSAQYQVIMHAPGSAGPTLPLVLETLNSSGHPVPDKGRGFPPVRAMAPETLALIGGAPDCTVPIRSLIAHRVSDNPASSLYNVYLSAPILLLYESLLPEELELLRTAPEPREAFWSAPAVRVGIDRALPVGHVLTPYAATLEVRALRAGITATARGFAADYLMGPNPPPLNDGAAVPGTFGTVSAHNGEFRLETMDLALPASRLPIRFERVCAGQDLYEGPFGRGWDFLYNQRLVELNARLLGPETGFPLVLRGGTGDEIGHRRDLLLHSGRARSLLYRYAGEVAPSVIDQDPFFHELEWNRSAVGFYLPPEGVFDFIVQFGDGRFARLEPDGTQIWYGPDGRLEEMRDRYPDNRLFFNYDEAGAMVRVVDRSAAVPRYVELGYYRMDGQGDTSFPNERTDRPALSGKVCRLRDYVGREVRFAYNDCGELERREGPRVSFAHEGGFTGEPVTTYTVSGSDATPSANGLRGVSAGGEQGGTLFTAGASPAAGVPVVSGGSGAGAVGAIALSLNHANTAAAVAGGQAKTEASLPDGSGTKMEFGPDGRVRVMTYSGAGADPAVFAYEYEGGLLRRVVHPEGNATRYEYFDEHPVLRSRGNLKRVTHDPGPRGVAGPERQAASYPTFERRFNFPVEETTDFAGTTIRLVPTPDGRDIATTEFGADGSVRRTFNGLGQLTSETSAQGVVTRYEHDEATGFLTGLVEGSGAAELRTKFHYEAPAGSSGFNPGQLGLPTRIELPEAGSEPIHLNYDEREQLITTRRGSQQVEKRSYDLNGHLVRLATAVEAGRERVVTTRFEQNGFLRESTLHDVEVEGAGGGRSSLTTAYEPDALFRVRKITFPGNRVREFHDFDHLGRPHRMTLGGYEEGYTFDRHGNLLRLTRGTAEDAFEYDGFDRLKREERAAEGGVEQIEYTYHPRDEGRSIKVSDAAGQVNQDVAWEVDALGRVTTEIIQADDGPSRRAWRYSELRTVLTEEASGEEIVATVDRAGRPDTTTDFARQITQRFDGNGNLKSLTSAEGILNFETTFSYDALDQQFAGRDLVGALFERGFRADAMPTNLVNALGHPTRIGLSLLGEPLSITRPNGVEFQFGYNDHRARAASRDRLGKGLTAHFDEEFRLDQTTRQDASVTTHSDADGRNQQFRRSSGSGVSTDRTFDAQGRLLTRQIGYDGDLRGEAFGYDALDRATLTSFPGGSWALGYDKLGPLKSAQLTAHGQSYGVSRTLRGDGAVTRLNYPAPESISVDYARDPAGRPGSVVPLGLDPVVSFTSYVGSAHPGEQTWGPNVIRLQQSYDPRGRVTGIRYVRAADQLTLADIRYQLDAVDNVQVRQSVHRSGRADVMLYDAGNRLIAAHTGVRPAVQEQGDRTGYAPFDLPLGLAGTWFPGFYSRGYQYDLDGQDRMLRVPEVNPDALPTLPFAREFLGVDPFVLPQFVDDFARTTDSVGNVTRARLLVWEPGASAPTPQAATLRYDGLNQLREIAREDGVRVRYDYDQEGLIFNRVVEDARLPGGARQTTLVWDQGRLLVEYDRTGGTNRFLARYYYFSGDVPVAMDRRDDDGELRRTYFLSDAQGSVVALADGAGQVVSRFEYDAWGQMRAEAPDVHAPGVHRVVATDGGFQLEFSETILPVADAPAFPQLQAGQLAFGDVARVRADGEVVDGVWRYEESVAGVGFGRVLRFLPGRALAGAVEVLVRPGMARDEWDNRNGAQTFNFAFGAGTAAGAVLQTGLELPPPPPPAVRSPFQFHGQYFDFEAGLVYMRQRFYEPSTGLFLQPDPDPYGDSPNQYAGFAQNPSSNRDPMGTGIGSRLPGGRQPLAPGTRLTPMGLGRSTPVPVHVPASPATVKAGGRAQALPADSGGAGPMVRAGRSGKVDEIAPTTARVQEQARPVPPAKPASQQSLERMGRAGKERIVELGKFKDEARAAGRLRMVEHDGDDMGIVIQGGKVVSGSVAKHSYNPKTGISTITVNSRLVAAARGSPKGSVLNKQLKLGVLHELAHAQNALGLGTRAGRGKSGFLEELGVHHEEISMEIALFGHNPSHKSTMRTVFEKGGDEGIANQLMWMPDYRRDQFGIQSIEQARRMLNDFGLDLRISHLPE